ncbi:MAG: hypothetical protein ACREME_04925, partial [Gemmatimonadales bacterium]
DTARGKPEEQRPAEGTPRGGRGRPEPAAAVKLDIPPGQLPDVGACRVWIPGTPPGRQPRPASRSCDGIASAAPAGSWIVYRPTEGRKLVHVRVVDPRRAGVVVRIRIFDIETNLLVREENP